MLAFAPAKINLTLHITGQRADGYHLLDSLVVFAGVGDQLTVAPASVVTLELAGPEASKLPLSEDNLVLRAARLFGGQKGAALTLRKELPVASGIGGGSADAAATLRALADFWNVPLPNPEAVLGLGADVPVCLGGGTVRMQGIGERITPVSRLPEMSLVLVNPRRPVNTPKIFSALKRRDNPEMQAMPTEETAFWPWLRAQRNDLQAPAISVAPVIAEVLAAIDQTDPKLARMSGSGATCFGVYKTFSAAKQAAETLEVNNPNWWVRAARVL
jgi:4-diphosphocytidyl-2-C-methyl-D-erythritol kinase